MSLHPLFSFFFPFNLSSESNQHSLVRHLPSDRRLPISINRPQLPHAITQEFRDVHNLLLFSLMWEEEGVKDFPYLIIFEVSWIISVLLRNFQVIEPINFHQTNFPCRVTFFTFYLFLRIQKAFFVPRKTRANPAEGLLTTKLCFLVTGSSEYNPLGLSKFTSPNICFLDKLVPYPPQMRPVWVRTEGICCIIVKPRHGRRSSYWSPARSDVRREIRFKGWVPYHTHVLSRRGVPVLDRTFPHKTLFKGEFLITRDENNRPQ